MVGVRHTTKYLTSNLLKKDFYVFGLFSPSETILNGLMDNIWNVKLHGILN